MDADSADLWVRRADRIAGAALVLGMALLALGALLHPSELDPTMRSRPGYVPIHLLIAGGLVLALPGVLRLIGRSIERPAALDLVAALACTLGWTLFLAQIVLEGLAVPVIQQDLGLETLDFLHGPAVVFYMIGGLGFAAGFPLLGWRLPRIGAPAWAARLLLIAPLPVLWPPLPDWLGRTTVAVFALGLAGLGVWLARGAGD